MEVINVKIDEDFLKQDKWYQLSRLKEGSKVLLTSKEEAIFTRLMQKNFAGTINGKPYDIPVNMFDKILEVAKENLGYKTLKPGELFYISNGKDALLFKYVCMEKGKIIGICPINNIRTKIQASMYAGKVSEL